ncbi:MAG: hypothetical protein ACLUL2_12055 [Blautia sp.]
MGGEKFREYFFADCKCDKIADDSGEDIRLSTRLNIEKSRGMRCPISLKYRIKTASHWQ